MMETQTSPKDEVAEVAELELEAVIGFNGETSSTSGLGGLGTPGTRSANRESETPGSTWKAAWDAGMSEALGTQRAPPPQKS